MKKLTNQTTTFIQLSFSGYHILCIKYIIITSTLIFIFFINNPSNLQAQDFSNFKYSQLKQAGGITYEVTATQLNDNGLTLEGWAYIADSQHYNNKDDLDIYFMTHKINSNEKRYYRANVNESFDMTDIEQYQGTRRCGETEYNKDAIECNYDYRYVGFNVNIPINEITYPNRYSLFLFAHAKQSNEKFYTQVYAPGTRSTHQIKNIRYEFESALDEAEMIVNNEQINVRTGPSKGHQKLNVDSYPRYFKNNTILKPKDKSFDRRLTWYQVPVTPIDEIINGHKLVIGSTGFQQKIAYIASIYINHVGHGYATIATFSNAEFKLERIMSPVVNNESFKLGYTLSTENIDEPTDLEVNIEYGSYKKTEVITVYPNQKLDNYTLIPKEYISNQEIKVSINQQNNKYNDNNLNDNQLTLNPYIEAMQTFETSLLKNQNEINIKLVSGFEQNHNELVKYIENITINSSPPIDKINKEWNEYDVEFNDFYAGGIFKYQLHYRTENEYPFEVISTDTTSSIIEINCEIIDIDNCENGMPVNLVKNGLHFINPNYENQNDKINITKIAYNNDNKIYTKLDAKPGKHAFNISLIDLGIAKINLKIASYIDIKGPLFGSDKKSLFYYRNVSRDNPMPDYQSIIWNNKLELLKNENKDSKKIQLSAVIKTQIKSWIEENYQENIKNNKLQN